LTQPSASSPQPRLLGPWRTACQWLCTLAVLGIPFVYIGGNSLLRLDFSTLSLQVGGRVFPIEALWLLLLFSLAIVLLFLLVTLAFGRAWCGWGCPQTTLVDLVEWGARGLGVKVSAGVLATNAWQKIVLQLLYLGLALLVGANLLWYFVSPYDFFPQLTAGALHWAAATLLGLTAATVYIDLAFLRRLFCKEFCPYGRFQTVLVDPGTLTLRYHPDEAPRCIRCGACARACPTGIDIRNGYQIECINCGRCLDACREVMARRNQQGIIRYTFGLEGRGLQALVNVRMTLVTLAFLVIAGAFTVAATQRSPLTLKVARNPALLPRAVAGERVLNFFTAYLVNRSSTPQSFSLVVTTTAINVQWRGSADPLLLAAGEHRRIDFGLEADARQLVTPQPVELALRDASGASFATTTLTLTGPLDKPAANRAQ